MFLCGQSLIQPFSLVVCNSTRKRNVTQSVSYVIIKRHNPTTVRRGGGAAAPEADWSKVGRAPDNRWSLQWDKTETEDFRIKDKCTFKPFTIQSLIKTWTQPVWKDLLSAGFTCAEDDDDDGDDDNNRQETINIVMITIIDTLCISKTMHHIVYVILYARFRPVIVLICF